MMNKKKQKISLLLSATLLLTSVPAMQYAISAETQAELQAENEDGSIINFDKQYSIDKVTLSYWDPTTAELKISFSEDGTAFGEPKTVKFDNQTDVSFELEEALTAKAVKVEGAEQVGLPKISLAQVTRYEATKDNVGAGTRGTDENDEKKHQSMWFPGHDNFAQWFDGTYDDDGNLTNVGLASSTGLYHDALKKGYTENKDDAMIELTFNFDEPEEFLYAVLYMDKGNTADFKVRILDDTEEDNKEEDNKEENKKPKYKILSELTKAKDFGDPVKIGNKEVYVIKAPINVITDSFNIYWSNFHDYITDKDTGKENARVDIPEMAFYYYKTVYESNFILNDGAECVLAEPKTFVRMVGELPKDMWYVGTTTDGKEVRFDKKDGSMGYLADKSYEIKKIKIQGYNAHNVKSAKFPESIEIYGEVSDLAKAAYENDESNVIFEKATIADFGNDPRQEYMDPKDETGVAALFDGDTQYNSYTPYHTFVKADPARLTIKDDGFITVDLGDKYIIDSVSYYAGPQYTPKKYTVLVSDDKDDFSNAKLALEKEYELLEGRLSPFTTPDQFYCSMHEDLAVEHLASGRYVRIVNDGVLKPESEHLVIENEKGETVVDTMMKNDAMMNKGVILVKELKIMGAPFVGTIEPDISWKYNNDDKVIAGNNKVTVNIKNKTSAEMNDITVYAAVYNTDGTLKSVKLKNISITVNAEQNVEIDGLTAEKGETIGVFVWDNEMTPMVSIPKMTVNQ